jgi:nitrogen regulatory protein P-II 1
LKNQLKKSAHNSKMTWSTTKTNEAQKRFTVGMGEKPKTTQLTLLVVILHDLDYFGEILETWKQIGVPGVTILQSVGSFQAQDLVNRTGLANFLGIFDQGKPQQRTLLALIDDENLLERAIAEADRIVRGFDRPRSGILFTLPAGQALGLKKWGTKPVKDEAELAPEKEASPLLQWFEEDLKARGEGRMLEDWRHQRATPVSEIMENLQLNPTIVHTDATLPQVVSEMAQNPRAELACVVNTEERLVGVIDQHQLGEAMLVNVVPEEFLESPEDYARAMDAANGKRPQIAADVMSPPLYVSGDDTLDVAYQKMHKAHLAGLPVVDVKYRVLGYISLLEVLSVCYPQVPSTDEP